MRAQDIIKMIKLHLQAVTYPEAFSFRYTGMGAQIIGAQIIVK